MMKRWKETLKRSLRRGESGQSVVLLAIGFIALVAFVGITTDVALMFVRFSQLSRAVDSAAVAAANQMRQDRSIASVGVAARQFVQFYGLNPSAVLIETCDLTRQADPLGIGDPELCPAGFNSKFVRVTAQVESPTVFLRLLGWQNFTLQAVAVSETAQIDVVVIFDVSESMLRYTTVEDWARIGQGVIYRPPIAQQVFNAKFAGVPGATVQDFWLGTGPITPGDSLLNTWQQKVNNRLYYNLPDDHPEADPAYTVQFNRTYFQSQYGTQNHPRPECRVRFFPFSRSIGVAGYYGYFDEATGQYVRLIRPNNMMDSLFGKAGLSWPPPSERGNAWDGFVPTYDFYGCCNDPNGNGLFEDLICQPFKQARDATELFIERIDFSRGDRMGLVTFDRGAYLVNPYGFAEGTVDCPTGNSNPACRGGTHMIEDRADALEAVRRLLGVRAEPYAYVYEPGRYPYTAEFAANPPVTARWSGFSAGVDATGQSVPLDFGRVNPPNINFATTYSSSGSTQANVYPESYNYPAKNNCPFQNAGMDRSLFFLGLQNSSNPNHLEGWASYQTPGGNRVYYSGSNPASYNIGMSYELFGSCRGTNFGAALREGNNALVNPNTTRTSGTIWIIVLLSDGAAGASDPVRRNRTKLVASEPYTLNTSTGQFGVRGQYGAFGLCPYGTPQNPGELVLTDGEVPPAEFPFCSDESPMTRHSCNFRPLYTIAGGPLDPLPPITRNVTADGETRARTVPPLGDANYRFYGETPGPSMPGEGAELEWNRINNNLYDVDLEGCDLLYDVDDYARDWADYIALRREGASEANVLLPAIFTIGFGLDFLERTEGTTTYSPTNQAHTQALCRLNVGDCLGEQLLRYIADLGDNNQLDNDYYQWLRFGNANGTIDPSNPYGPRDACQTPDGPVNGTYDLNGNGQVDPDELARMYGQLRPMQNCGNYYNAPDYNQLQFVFDDIASRMFTRLAR